MANQRDEQIKSPLMRKQQHCSLLHGRAVRRGNLRIRARWRWLNRRGGRMEERGGTARQGGEGGVARSARRFGQRREQRFSLGQAAAFLLSMAARCSAISEEGEAEAGELTAAAASDIVESAVDDGEEAAAEIAALQPQQPPQPGPRHDAASLLCVDDRTGSTSVGCSRCGRRSCNSEQWQSGRLC